MRLTVFARMIPAAAALALVLGVGVPERVAAQAALLGPGAAYLSGGVLRVSTAQLDARLAARGYPTFGRSAGTFGVGAYRTLTNGVMLGFEAQGIDIGVEAHDDVGLGGGYATLGVGYMLTPARRMRVYPRIGIGGGGLALEIRSDVDTVRFDDVLTTGAPAADDPSSVLSRDGLVVDLGGGVEFLPGRRSGLLIGVRLGYLAAPWDSNWDLYARGARRRSATGGPDASISGPYVRVVVGGAWRR